MAHHLFVVLHGGHGMELTLLEYLYVVLLHLLAFGAVVFVALRPSCVANDIRSVISRGRG